MAHDASPLDSVRSTLPYTATADTHSYPHVMNQLNGPTAPKYTFLVFYASVVDGQMWCPVRLA